MDQLNPGKAGERTILVTGGTGLIGSHLLCKLLVKGQTVRAVKRKSSDITIVERLSGIYGLKTEDLTQGIEWVNAELDEEEGMRTAFGGITHVYHCAGAVSFDPREKEHLRRINVSGTSAIVRLCLEMHIKKLCHVSSASTLGKKGNAIIDEETPWDEGMSISDYGRSKFEAEAVVFKGIAEGLDAVVVNPVVVLGQGDWNRSSLRIFKAIADGLPAYPSGSNAVVDVRDVVDAMLGLMESQIRGKRFLLSGHNVTHRELFRMIATKMGKTPPKIRITPPVAKAVLITNAFAKRFFRRGLPLYRATLVAGMQHSRFSSEKIRAALQFSFTPLEKTIEDCCDFFLRQQKEI